MTKRSSERGNIFFALFGAVALVGVVGAATSTLMRGPVSTVMSVNQRTKADTQMQIASKLAMVRASQEANSGDCDMDATVEPLPPDAFPASHPMITMDSAATLNAALPADIGAAQIDPWNTRYGYCAWDLGATVGDIGCVGSGTRLSGGNNESYPVMVIISAGPDKTFQTECNSWVDANTDDIPDNATTLIDQTTNTPNDDIILGFTYSEAVEAAGGLWSMMTGDPSKITTDKGVAFTSTVDFQAGTTASFQGTAQFSGNSRLDLGFGANDAGLFLLPNETELTTCNAANEGSLRIDSSASKVLQVCDRHPSTLALFPSGWAPIGGAGTTVSKIDDLSDAKSAPAEDTLFLGDAAGLNYSSGSGAINNLGVGIGAASNLTTGTGNLVIGNNSVLGAATNADNIIIGHGLTGGGSDTLKIGNFLSGSNIYSSSGSLAVGGALDVGGTAAASRFEVDGIASYIDTSANGLVLGAGGSSIVTVESGGNVGIGVTDPNTALDVSGDAQISGDTTSQHFLADSGSAGGPAFSFGSGSGLGMYNSGMNALGFATAGINRVTIDSTGLGIGISPSVALDVSGAGEFTGSVSAGSFQFTSGQGMFPAGGGINLTGGNVGISQASPNTTLDVGGEIKVGATDPTDPSCPATWAGSIRYGSGDTLEYCSSDGSWYDIASSGGGGGGAGSYWTRLGDNRLFYDAADVGVGTNNPLANFHANGNLLVTGTLSAGDTTPVSGAGTRMMFIPNRAAFRGGQVSGAQWDHALVGTHSFAFGLDVQAPGAASFVVGEYSQAGGANSIAMGGEAIASGAQSVVIGNEATASGDGSFAFGLVTAAATNPVVSGARSFGIFMGNQSGVDVTADNVMTLLGGSLVIDSDTTAPATSLNISRAGMGIDVKGDIGATQYCDEDGLDCFTAGDIAGGGVGVWEDVTNVIRLTSGTVNYASADFVFGSPQLDGDGNTNHDIRMFFDKETGAFRAGGAATAWDDANRGLYSFAGGLDTLASGTYSVALGRLTQATQPSTVAIGSYAQATGYGSVSIGHSTGSEGLYSHAMGAWTTASGDHSAAIGLGGPAGAYPEVTGDSSLGIFMGDQSALNFASSNRFGLFGGRMIIDPAVPSTQLTTSGTLSLDVEGQVGATEYCDENGLNCFTASGVSSGSFAAGNDREVQFNSGGSLGASTGLVFTATNDLQISADLMMSSSGKIYSGAKPFIGLDEARGNTIISVDEYGGNAHDMTGNQNTLLGKSSGEHLTTGGSNTVLGYAAGYDLTTASGSTLLGAAAGTYVTGSYVTAVGTAAMQYSTAGTNSTALGYAAGQRADGANNIFIGYAAGSVASTGNLNILIGPNLDLPTAATSNYLNIGGAILGDMVTGNLQIAGSAALTLPRGDNAQRPASPVNGMLRYNSANGKFEGYQAGAWQDLLTGAATSTFLSLSDTPASYAGAPNQYVRVNATTDALEFTDEIIRSVTGEPAPDYMGLNDLLDVEFSVAPTEGQFLQYNSASGLWQAGTASASSVLAAGADTQLQFNSGGSFGAQSSLFYNRTEGWLHVDGTSLNQAGVLVIRGNDSPAQDYNDAILSLRRGSTSEIWQMAIRNNVPGYNGDLNLSYYNGSAWTTPVSYTTAGRIGMYTNSPSTTLDVRGTVRFGYGTESCVANVAGGVRYNSGTGTLQLCDGAVWGEVGSAVDTFLELTDSPASYAGAANQYVRVNATSDALEFTDQIVGTVSGEPAPTFMSLDDLEDVNLSVAPTTGQILGFNGTSWVATADDAGSGGTPAGADTQIQFNSAGAFGAVSTLVYTSTGRVGIGTATPSATLDIIGPPGTGASLGYALNVVGSNGGGGSSSQGIRLLAGSGMSRPPAQLILGGSDFLGGNTYLHAGQANNNGTPGFVEISGGPGWNLDGGNVYIAGGEKLNAGDGHVVLGVNSSGTVIGRTLVGTTTPTAGAMLKIGGTDSVLLPSGTTAQRPTGTNGMLRYNSDNGKFEGYQAGAWQDILTGSATMTFLGLTDTPASYAGAPNQYVRVNAATSALEFTDEIVGTISGQPAPDFIGLDALSDVDLSVAPSDGQVLQYDSASGTWSAGAGGSGGGAINDLSDGITDYPSANMFLGEDSGVNETTAIDNTALGYYAQRALTEGQYNTAIGSNALPSNQTGDFNTAVGYASLLNNTESFNTAIGYRTLRANTLGTSNTAVGYQSMDMNTVGINNTAIGMNSLVNNVAQHDSTAIGYDAMRYANDTAVPAMSYNTALGAYALRGSTTPANNTGVRNTAIGHGALIANTSGSWNTALGQGALSATTSGGDNTALGQLALAANVTGIQNTAVGAGSLNLSSGNYNVALGFAAGDNITTGSNNIMIGTTVDAAVATASNQLNIGNVLTGDMTSGDIAINGTAALTLPRGDTAQRPASPVNGMLRYNSATSKFEGYQAGAWIDLIGGAGGSSTFLALTDTPASYGTSANRFVRVNAAENALEFTDEIVEVVTGQPDPVYIGLDHLTDVDLSVAPTDGQFLKYVSASGSWVAANSTGGTATPAGSTGEIQFNSGGALTAVPRFTISDDGAVSSVGINHDVLTEYTDAALIVADSSSGNQVRWGQTWSNSSTIAGYLGFSGSGQEVDITANNAHLDLDIGSYGGSNHYLRIFKKAADGNSVQPVTQFFRENVSAAGADGNGASIETYLESSTNGTNSIASQIQTVATTAAPATFTSRMTMFPYYNNAATTGMTLLGAANGTLIGINNLTPAVGLDVNTVDALIVPRGDTAQRPASPANGMLRYNSATSKFEGYQAGAWVDLIGGGGSTAFLSLTDTPSSYAASANQYVRVNATTDALEFTDEIVGTVSGQPAPNFIDLDDITDVDLSVAPTNGQVLGFNGTSWVAAAAGGGGGGSAAGADRQIQFNSGGAFGADASLVFTSAARMGIGTATPQATVHLNGPGSTGSLAISNTSTSGVTSLDLYTNRALPTTGFTDGSNKGWSLIAKGDDGAHGGFANRFQIISQLHSNPGARQVMLDFDGVNYRMGIGQMGQIGGLSAATLHIFGTDAIVLAAGSTAQRPGTPVNGMLRYNSSSGKFEGYQAGAWQDLLTGVVTTNFLSLTDTPSSYASSANKYVRVNATTDALEFTDEIIESVAGEPDPDYIDLDDLSDVDLSVAPTNGQVLGFNGTSWIAQAAGAGGSAAGADRQIQFNSGGTFGADANFVLTADGKLGLGLNNPGSLFQVSKATDEATMRFSGDGTWNDVVWAMQSLSSGNIWQYAMKGSSDVAGYGNLIWEHYDNGLSQWIGVLTLTKAGKVGMGGVTAPQADLDIGGTGGLLVPRGSTAQRLTGVNGMLRYNSSSGKFEGYQAGAWQDLLTGAVTTNFLSLTDTPSSYATSANKFVRVNAATDALEFTDEIVRTVTGEPNPVYIDIDDLADVDLSVAPTNGQFLSFNGTSWVAAAGGGGGSAAGADRQIQFNSGGNFSADSNLVYTSTGMLGIGTATPQVNLDIVGAETFDPAIQIQNTASNGVSGFKFINDTGAFKGALGQFNFNYDGLNEPFLIAVNDQDLGFVTGDTGSAPGTVRMVIKSTGVGIGTITPLADLDIGGTGALLVPRGATGSRPASPVNGMLRYNSSSGKFEAYQAGAWQDLLTGAVTTNFLSLTDTPGSYAASANKFVRVNAATDALEFTDEVISTVSGQPLPSFINLNDLDDVDLSTAPTNGQVLSFNGTSWVAAAAGGGGGSVDSLSDAKADYVTDNNLLIGTPADAWAIGVGGKFNVTLGQLAGDSITTGDNNLAIGYRALTAASTAGYNIAIGKDALQSSTSGSDNVAIGDNVMSSNTSGYGNIAIGNNANTSNRGGSETTVIGYNAMLYGNSVAATTTTYNTAIGYEALRGSTTASANTGVSNTAVGHGAMRLNSSGLDNAALGAGALNNNTTGSYNAALGEGTLYDQTTGTRNTAIGWSALTTNVAKQESTAVGYSAMLYADSSGTGAVSYNTAVGAFALRGSATPASNTGTVNTAIGHNAMYSNTSGSRNTALGHGALYFNTTANDNTALGQYALAFNTTGVDNVAIGSYSLDANSTGAANVAIGQSALSTANTGGNTAVGAYVLGQATGASNTAFGSGAGFAVTSGANNLFLGYQAGNNVTTGSSNIAIGHDVDPVSATASSQLNIGNTIYGDLSTDRIGIGASPATGVELDVTGDVQYTGTLTDVSDRRLKTDIHPLRDRGSMLDKLGQIDTYSFRMKDVDKGQVEFGVMAQDIQAIFPELVRVDQSTPENYLSVNYIGLVAPLIEATQELKAENDNLKAQLGSLESKMASIEADMKGMKAHTGYGISKAGFGMGMAAGLALMGGLGAGVMIRRRRKAG